MEIFQLDSNGRLFISPDVDDWSPLEQHGIHAVFDLGAKGTDAVTLIRERRQGALYNKKYAEYLSGLEASTLPDEVGLAPGTAETPPKSMSNPTIST